MAYNLNSYLSSIQKRPNSSLSKMGFSGGFFNNAQRGIKNFMNTSPMQGYSSYKSSKPTTYNLSPRPTPLAPGGMSVAPKPPANFTPVPATASATSTTPTPAPLPPSGSNYLNLLGSTSTIPQLPQIPSLETQTQQPKEAEDPYLSYLKSLFDPEALKTATQNLTDINQRTADEIKRARDREDELRKNEAGQLETGQSYQLGENERLSNKSLADLAIAKGANMDVYNQMLAAGKSVYEAEQEAKKAGEGFTLSEGQTRYDANGNIIAGGSQYGGFDSGYVQGQDPIADSWVQYMRQNGDISKVPDEYKSLALQGSQSQGMAQSETSKSALGIVNELLQLPTNRITGLLRNFAWLPGTQGANTKAKYDQLKSLLQLSNIKLLKGTGAISDAEQRILEKASTSLNRKLSDKAFVKVLNDLKTELSTVQVGNQSIITTNDGLRWQKLPDGSYQQVSFNQVGSGTANAQSIASAIKQVESQGNYNAKGGSGENGAYQFMPSTWKGWAGEILGNPNAPMTPANQDKVAIAKINQWIQQGYNPQQIALMWNGGTPTVKKGTNKYGVAYDSGAYANKVLKQLYG